MKKKYSIIFILLLLLNTKCKSQIDSAFQIGLFSEYRITPIYIQQIQSYFTGSVRDIYHNPDKQLSGGRLGVQFRISLIKNRNLTLGFQHIIGYDHIYYESINGNKYSPNAGELNSHKTLLSDFLFDLKYKFSLNSKAKFSVAIGWGLFNRGSEYAVRYQNLDANGQPAGLFYTSEQDFNYNPICLLLNYEKNSWSLGLNAYLIDQHNFIQPSDILLLAFRIGHTFQIKKK